MLITVGGIVLLWIADTFSVCRFRFRESNHFRQDFWQFSAKQNLGNCDIRRRGDWYVFASLCLQLLIFICPQEWLRTSGIDVSIMIRGRFFDGSTASLQVMLIIFGGIVLFTLADIFLFADFDSEVQSFSAGFLAIFGNQNSAIPVGRWLMSLLRSVCNYWYLTTQKWFKISGIVGIVVKFLEHKGCTYVWLSNMVGHNFQSFIALVRTCIYSWQFHAEKTLFWDDDSSYSPHRYFIHLRNWQYILLSRTIRSVDSFVHFFRHFSKAILEKSWILLSKFKE